MESYIYIGRTYTERKMAMYIEKRWEDIARETSCQAAMLLSTLGRLISCNRKKDLEQYGADYRRMKHCKAGRWWTFGTVQEMSEACGYLSVSQVRTALDKLIDADYIIRDSYNVRHYDRTGWYALSDKGLAALGLVKTEAKPENKPATKEKKPEGKKEAKQALKKEETKEKRQVNAEKLLTFMVQIGVIDAETRAADTRRWSEMRLAGQIDQGLYDAGLEIIKDMNTGREGMAK